MKSLTLSVVSHGQGALLVRLLGDLRANPSLTASTVIVTLNLEEAFDPVAFKPLRIKVVRNASPKGFGANHNAAFSLCDTEWFAVLNPDLRVPEDPWPALFAASVRWPNLALIAPRVLGSTGLPEDAVRPNLTPLSVLTRRFHRRLAPMLVVGPTQIGNRFYWLAGMFLLLRASAFRAIGGFDERYFMYCEDYDLCARLYTAGYGLAVVPGAAVVHAAQRDSHRALQPLRWHFSSLLKVWTSGVFWRVTLRLIPVPRTPK